MGDVAERAAVDDRRPTFQCLEEVGLDRIPQKDRHRSGHLDVVRGHRSTVGGHRQNHSPQSCTEILEIVCQRQDRHDLRGDGDLPLVLAGRSILPAAQPDDHVSQRSVADVDDARPGNRVGVDAQRVLVMDAVVQERGGQIVRRSNRVVVAGQVEIEVLHRNDLAVATAGRPALDAEDRSERRLADRRRGLPTDSVQALRQADRGGGLALAQRRRVDGRDHDVLAPRALRLQPDDGLEPDLGLDRAVQLDLVFP